MCVFDLSKTFMYNFHYIIKKQGHKVKLIFTGTDNLTDEIETNDIYEDFHKNKDKLDFSKHPKNSKFYDKTNEKVIVKIKYETKCIPGFEYGHTL